MKSKRLFSFIAAIIMMFSVCTVFPIKISVPLQAYASTDVSNLQPVDSTYSLIKSLEGCDLNCFWDVKQWTIGYGNKCPYTHTSNGTYWHQPGGHSISESEARSLFSSKLSGYVSTLKSNCSGLSMTQNQFDALLSATYNHGNVNNCPLKYYLQGKLTETEAREQYYVWCINAGTKDEQGLRNRRKKEADVFFSNPNPDPPEPPTLSINRNSGTSNDVISITWNAAKYADSYWLHIYKDGEDYINQTLNQKLSYSAKYPVGKYTAYVVSCNSQGEALSSVDFSICDSTPEKPAPYIEKKSYSINETVTITWNKTQLTDSYWLHIYRNGEDYINQTLNQELSYSAKYPVGKYTAYIVSCNSKGETLSSVDFSVYDTKPDAPKLNINKTLFASKETVSLSWSAVADTTHYWLLIMKDGVQYKSQSLAQALAYSEKFPAGKYEVAISAVNQYGYTAGIVFFTVYDSKPDAPKIKIEKTEFSPNEFIKISWEEVPNATYYWVNISKNGESYISQQAEALSYEAQFPNGSYDVAISAANPYGYSVTNASFHVGISGDINNDDKFTVADAVLLQKWLLSESDTELVNWKAADLCEDDRIDVFDMIEMRKLIINSQSAQ